ncbi:MAG: LysR family transcriptional regulator [Lachnospiraceae bacterium]|nr:LysR family transcriptional regulator [Lachnospiraceae bacterium]
MDYTLSSVTIQQVYVFLEAVKKGSFTGAGEQLHMTQSAVSKSIAKLEQNLGLTLFIRSNRELHLTEAGKMIYDEWEPLFQSMDSSYRMVVQSQKDMRSTLHLGLTSAARPDRYFWSLADKLRDMDPSVSLQLETKMIPDLIHDLKNNLYDAVMVPDFEHYSLETEDLAWKWAARSNACIIIPRNHPLAHKESVTMEDLIGQSFIALRHDHTDNYFRDLKDRFAPYFSVPKIQLSFQSVYDLKAFYRSESGALFFADNYVDDPSDPNFVRIPVKNQYTGIICSYKLSNKKPVLKKFLAVLPE